jgi:hypothetical protein
MPKPSSLPRWANVGGAIVEPSPGKKDVGWVPPERPGAQYFNWLLNLIYQWIVWLDGFLAEAHTWTGAATFQNGVTLNTAGTLSTTRNINCNSGADIVGSSGSVINTFDSVTAGTLEGTTSVKTAEADIKHGDRITQLPASLALVSSSWAHLFGTSTTPDQITAGTTANADASFGLVLPVGARLKAWKVRVLDVNSGGATLSATLWKRSNGGNQTQVGSTQTSAANGTEQDIGQSGLTETVATGTYYRINVRNDNTTNGKAAYYCEYTYDRT